MKRALADILFIAGLVACFYLFFHVAATTCHGQVIYNRYSGIKYPAAAFTAGSALVAGGDTVSVDQTPEWTGQHRWSAGGLLLDDNVKALFGSGGATDSEIYFDGTDMVQKSSGAIKQQTDELIWVTTAAGMTISNPLLGDIIIADPVTGALTIKVLNLAIEEHVELYDLIDVRPTDSTISTADAIIFHDSTFTLNAAASNMVMLKSFWLDGAEWNYTTTPTSGIGPIFFMASPYVRASAATTLSGASAVWYAPYIIADGATMTLGGTLGAVHAMPIFGTAAGGSFDASADFVNFYSGANIAAGTIDSHKDFWIVNAIGAGTLNYQYGIYIADLTKGATADYGIYIAGADTYAIWVDADVSRFDGEIEANDLNTGSNTLTSYVCVDGNGRLCTCTTCL